MVVTRRRILIVDDDPLIVQSFAAIFRSDGYAVAAAADADEALARARGGAFDVILLDVVLPGADGVEIVEALRRAAPASAVVVLSASPDVDVADALARGATEVIMKPPDVGELLGTVARLAAPA